MCSGWTRRSARSRVCDLRTMVIKWFNPVLRSRLGRLTEKKIGIEWQILNWRDNVFSISCFFIGKSVQKSIHKHQTASLLGAQEPISASHQFGPLGNSLAPFVIAPMHHHHHRFEPVRQWRMNLQLAGRAISHQNPNSNSPTRPTRPTDRWFPISQLSPWSRKSRLRLRGHVFSHLPSGPGRKN